MIGQQNKVRCGLLLIVPAILLALSAVAYSESIQDHDGDRVPDSVDADHDNDGLLNSTEGFVVVGDPSLLATNEYESQPVEPGASMPRDQVQGSSYSYRLKDTVSGRLVDFQGSVLSTNTSINWARHVESPKLQHEQPGLSYVRWTLYDAATLDALSIDIDLVISDLDIERNEVIEIERQSVIGYSLARESAIVATETNDGKVFFSAEGGDSAGASVILHVRRKNQLVIGYKSSKNRETIQGLNNDRAGFRHELISQDPALYDYFALEQRRDTDQDGIPDHLDLDSDNDGIFDVTEVSGVDDDRNGVADGRVNSIGVPATAGSGLAIVDVNQNGLADPYDTEPVINSDISPGAGNGGNSDESAGEEKPLDSDRDGLTDVQEMYLGTNPEVADTDGDGFSDAEEVIVFHSNPLSSVVEPAQQDPLAVVPVQSEDSDNDGITDAVETMFDEDGDGVPNQYDLDSDNDGIADVLEAGFNDIDADGKLDSSDLPRITQWSQLANDDDDGMPNAFDLDSDNDGIADLLESSESDIDSNGVVDTQIDRNGDGWHDPFYGLPRALPDLDNDGVADYIDSDQLQAAIIQSDPTPSATGSLLQTGLQGGAGCTIDASSRDVGLIFLLLFALTGLMLRCRACRELWRRNQ